MLVRSGVVGPEDRAGLQERGAGASGRVACGPVLVTGCSSGIGEAVALRLARAGWLVYATARQLDTLDGCARAGCRTLSLDVTSEASMQAAVSAIVDAHGAVGALVNVAGYSQSGAIEAVPPDDVRRQFETNVFGPARLMQLVLPGMRHRRGGRIINISSMGGRLTLPGGGYYHATKHALEALSDAVRFEVARFGIDVVVVQPGLIRSRFAQTATSSLDNAWLTRPPYARFHAEVARITAESYVRGPMARLTGTPDDVARIVEGALRARRPRTRYTVSASATFLLTLRRMLPDRLWDRFLARTYPQPGTDD